MNPDDEPVALPVAWRIAFVWQQLVVLALAGVALLLTTNGSSIYAALLAGVPDVPIGVGRLPGAFLVPLLLPLVVGLPLALTRRRAPLLLWLGLMTLLAVLAVIEVSRLNWFAFASGIAFRLSGGPVPLVRTIGGAALLLSGAALIAHQSVHLTLLQLARRGLNRQELTEVRRGLLGLERSILAVAFGAAIVLTLVAAISMSTTEGAPDVGGRVTLWLLWALILTGLLVGALYWGARRPDA